LFSVTKDEKVSSVTSVTIVSFSGSWQNIKIFKDVQHH
jgi:hypothetical protein